MDFYSAIKQRRSTYGISPESKISDERIEEVIKHVVLHAPSPFNCQSARVILLLGEHHKKLWDITLEELKKIIPADKLESTKEKINSFASGYGSVLFFDDEATIKGLQEKFPLYKDNFPDWGRQANGMIQYMIWTSLVIEGFGVSLQHYNPLIDNNIKKQWNISEDWKLIAQMPFGVTVQSPDEKTFLPIEKRLIVYNK